MADEHQILGFALAAQIEGGDSMGRGSGWPGVPRRKIAADFFGDIIGRVAFSYVTASSAWLKDAGNANAGWRKQEFQWWSLSWGI